MAGKGPTAAFKDSRRDRDRQVWAEKIKIHTGRHRQMEISNLLSSNSVTDRLSDRLVYVYQVTVPS